MMLLQPAEAPIHDRAVRVVAVLLTIVTAEVVFGAVPGVVLLLVHQQEDLRLLPYRLTIVEVQLHLPEVIRTEVRHVVPRLLPPVVILLRAVVLLVQAVAIQVVVLLPVRHPVAVPSEVAEGKTLC